MKAVNLIPAEERRGAGGSAGRSGGAVYVVLGALALLVVVVGLWAHAGGQVDDRKAELARAEREAVAAEARAASLAAYTSFNALRVRRTETVRSIASSRFDWAHALNEVSRVIPEDVALESVRGTVAPGVAVKGAAVTNPLRAADPAPALEIVGCSADQAKVARMLTRMRLIDGVKRVSLQESKKLEDSKAEGAAGGVDCRRGDASVPRFNLVAFFDAVPPKGTPAPAAAAAAPTAAAPGAAGAVPATPAPAAPTTPAPGATK